MNLEQIKLENLEIAKSKGFGITLNDISFPEKIALIHSEISEAYQALLLNNLTERHGFYEEMADVALRLLHLAGALDISFSQIEPVKFKVNISLEGMLLNLHNFVSESYEQYRHKNLDSAKQKLVQAIYNVRQIAELLKFDLESEIYKKMQINKNREWDKKNLNEELK